MFNIDSICFAQHCYFLVVILLPLPWFLILHVSSACLRKARLKIVLKTEEREVKFLRSVLKFCVCVKNVITILTLLGKQ